MNLITSLILAAILTQGIFVSAADEIRVDRASLHTESKLPDGRHLSLSIEIVPYSRPSAQIAFEYGGDSKTYQPHRVIESISINLAGRAISIPTAAYADLGDPTLCAPEVLLEGKNLIFRIYGGNAGWSSYYADILIRGAAAFERRVTNPQEATVVGKSYKPDIKNLK